MSYNFTQRATALGFSRKLLTARTEAIANGRSIALVKHLRSDEWTIVNGMTVLVPDVIVHRDGKAIAQTMIGRRALAQTSS